MTERLKNGRQRNRKMERQGKRKKIVAETDPGREKVSGESERV